MFLVIIVYKIKKSSIYGVGQVKSKVYIYIYF